MSLPKLETPTYKLKIPSTGKTVSFRPFLVKEEKLLMMSKESKNQAQIFETLRRLITNCILDEIDFDSLTSFDVEYIFLQFRSKSVGEDIELMIPCESCGAKNPTALNLDEDVYISKPEKKIDFKIPLTSTVGVIMKYPNVVSLSGDSLSTIDMIVASVDSIYDETTVHKASDYTKKELSEFIGGLSMKDMQKVQDFFENMPKVKAKISFCCNQCSTENETEVEGINNFF